MEKRKRRPLAVQRKNIPVAVRRKVFERDNHRCRKCGREESLNLHHIIPVVDHGTDTVENLMLLCKHCHREWEFLIYPRVRTISFEQWLELPSCPEFLAIFANKDKWPDDLVMPMQEVRDILVKGHQIAREARSWGA